jgi:propanol-preferring alcohol dehydrogenase
MMRAWWFTGANEPLQLVEREDPRPGPGQAVVAVRAAGLCHSDVGCLDGTITALMPKVPLVLGHEVAGVVAELGPGVSGFDVGDRVLISGPEEFIPGWTADGGYATACLAMAEGLVRLPPTVNFVQGATATDAGSTSYGAVMRSGAVQAGQKVGIVGLGGLGMTGARIAVLNGAEVYAAEPRTEVWPLAKEQGVVEVVDDVRGLAPYDLDLIVDFAGFGTTTAGAITAVRAGGLVVQVGLGHNEATISTAALTSRMVTLRGHRGGSAGIVEEVLAHMSAGDLTIQATTVGFDDIPDALDRLGRGGVIGRIVATIGDD